MIVLYSENRATDSKLFSYRMWESNHIHSIDLTPRSSVDFFFFFDRSALGLEKRLKKTAVKADMTA